MEKALHELVVVEGSVEPKWKTVANSCVAYVKARFTCLGKDVMGAVVGVGSGYLVMNEKSVDEGDGEAVGGKLDGQMNKRDYVALERVRDHQNMRVVLVITVVFHY